MRVVLVDQGFSLTGGGGGTRSWGFAARLAARGHQVTVLTSDREMASSLPGNAGLVHRFDLQGVAVCVINAGLARSASFARGMRSHLVFALTSTWQLLRMDRPDVVYVTSPPLGSALPALFARWLRGLPFVFEARDLLTDLLVGVRTIRSSLLVALLRRIERVAYRRARRIVVLAEPAARRIGADLALADKITLIPNYCDVEWLGRGDGTRIRADHGWADKFVCLHAGPINRANGLEAILRIADVLREDEQFVFWLVGDGSHRPALEQNIRDRKLTNVAIWPDPSRESMPDILAAADLCLLTVGAYPVLEQSHGDRLFNYLAAGRPVLMNYGGWQRQLIKTHQAGLGTEMGRYEQFYQRVCDLCDQPDKRREMARNARRLAETEFHFDRIFEAFEEVLTEAAGGSAPPVRHGSPARRRAVHFNGACSTSDSRQAGRKSFIEWWLG